MKKEILLISIGIGVGGLLYFMSSKKTPQLIQSYSPQLIQSYSHLIYTDGSEIFAQNGKTGKIDYSGVYLNDVLNLIPDHSTIEIVPSYYEMNGGVTLNDTEIYSRHYNTQHYIKVVGGYKGYLFTFNYGRNRIEGLRIETEGANGIYLTDRSADNKIYDMWFNSNAGGTAIFATNTDFKISKVHIFGFNYGIYCVTCADCFVSETKVGGTKEYTGSQTGIFIATSANMNFDQVNVHSNDIGYQIQGSNRINISDGLIELNGHHGIRLSAGSLPNKIITITGNRILENGQGLLLNSSGIFLSSLYNTTGMIIANNIIGNYSNVPPGYTNFSQKYGIFEDNSNIVNSIYTGNIFEDIAIKPIIKTSEFSTAIQNFGSSPFNHGNHNTEPTAFGAGDKYFNTNENKQYYYNGTTWN